MFDEKYQQHEEGALTVKTDGCGKASHTDKVDR